MCWYSYLWWATALLARTTAVKTAKATLWIECPARAKPTHSVISPRKFAPDTYSNIPPVGGIKTGMFIPSDIRWCKKPKYFTFQNNTAGWTLSFQVMSSSFFRILWVDSSTPGCGKPAIYCTAEYSKITTSWKNNSVCWGDSTFPWMFISSLQLPLSLPLPFYYPWGSSTDSTALVHVPVTGVLNVFCFGCPSANASRRLLIYGN